MQSAVRYPLSLSDPVLRLVTQANNLMPFEAMNRKGLNAMPALLKFLVPLAIFLSGSYAHAFTSLSPVPGNQARVNHLIRFEEPMSNPTNEPSREPTCEPTNDSMVNDQTTDQRLEDAELPNILSPKRGKYSLSQK